MIGRSHSVTGPYVDKKGVALTDGGGTPLLVGNIWWIGPGGESVLMQKDGVIMVYHAYDAKTGEAWLQISTVSWKDGWPHVALEGGDNAGQ